MPLNIKNINNFTQWKKVDHSMWGSRALSHTKSTSCSPGAVRAQSAVDIFNTLRVFTKEPIREQEIKLECMNLGQTQMDLSVTTDYWPIIKVNAKSTGMHRASIDFSYR